MRLCFVSRDVAPGGPEGGVLTRARDAARAGHDVTLISDFGGMGEAAAAELAGEGIEVRVPPPLTDGRAGHYYHPDHEYADRVYGLVRELSGREPFNEVDFANGEGFTCVRARRLLGEFAQTRLSVPARAEEESGPVTDESVHAAYMLDYGVRHAGGVVKAPAEAGRGDTRVSVVVPFHNQGEWLKEAIDSALASDHQDLEVVVVNDGSTEPASIEAFQRLGGDRIVKVDKPRGGLSSARNAGIAAGSGAFVLPLDADDVIDSRYVGEAVRALRANPELGYVTCYVRTFGAEDGYYIPLGFVRETLAVCNPAGKCTSLFRREVLEELGGYDEGLPFFEDWDLLCRLAATRWDGDVLPRTRFHYRRHADSMVTNIDPGERVAVMQRLLANSAALLKAQSPVAMQVLLHWHQVSHRAELRWMAETRRLEGEFGRLVAEAESLREVARRTGEELAEAQSEADRSRREHDRASAELERERALGTAMRESLSWRVTAPLRFVARILRGRRSGA